MKKITPHIIILCLYFLFTIFLTYPQIRHLKQGIYSLSDQLFYSWMIERNIESFKEKPLSDFFNASIFYPYRNTLSFGDHMLGETILAFPLFEITKDPVFAQNVLLLLSFVLTAYGMFLYTKYITNNWLVAFIAGFLFSFSHVRFNQYDHLNIISTQWIPFVFLYVHKYVDDFKKKDLILLFIFYLLTILLTVYYLIMLTIAIGVYLICLTVFKRVNIRKRINKYIYFFLTIGIAVALLTPSLLQYFQFSHDFPQIKRSIQDNIIYSASIFSYFTDSRTTIASRIAGLSNFPESEAGLFPGLAVIVGALLSFFSMKKNLHTKSKIIFFLLIAVIFFLLSLGPFLKFNAKTVTSLPLPYYYLYTVFFPLQIVRVPARFAIFFELFLVIVASFGIQKILESVNKKKIQIIITSAIILVGTVDTWSVPLPLILVEPKKDFPEVYVWLKDQPQDASVLELPIPIKSAVDEQDKQRVRYAFMENVTLLDRDSVEAYRNYFSLLHGKRIVNGYSAFAPPIYLDLAVKTENFPDDKAIEAIKLLDVDYVIVHLKLYSPDEKEKLKLFIFQQKNIKIVKQFNDDIVLRVQ